MYYISQPGGCWAEDMATGRVAPIVRSALYNYNDTPLGHRFELWQAIDQSPEKVWVSHPYEIYPNQSAVITVFVDLEINSIYIMVPSLLGSTVKISQGTHSKDIDICRSALCSDVSRSSKLVPSNLRGLFQVFTTTSSEKLQRIALIALSSLNFGVTSEDAATPNSN